MTYHSTVPRKGWSPTEKTRRSYSTVGEKRAQMPLSKYSVFTGVKAMQKKRAPSKSYRAHTLQFVLIEHRQQLLQFLRRKSLLCITSTLAFVLCLVLLLFTFSKLNTNVCTNHIKVKGVQINCTQYK